MREPDLPREGLTEGEELAQGTNRVGLEGPDTWPGEEEVADQEEPTLPGDKPRSAPITES
ncbi:MAG TPA: hypothetical protein VER55_05070 [Ardenticatenaceae bacterium]|nr:hypothetical protein [Ardenticatenaceae bacterium]